MIQNLPKKITPENLKQIDFGNIEANDDSLLFDSLCVTSSINDFLNGSKNIVTGEKGTGKTALFRLIKEEKVKFKKKNGYKNIIIPIEDNFHYKNIKGKLLKLISVDSDEESFKYQVIWELYLFKKIINKLTESPNNRVIPTNISEIKNTLENVFNPSNEKLISIRRKFGMKLYDATTLIMPDFYYEEEPVITDNDTKKTNLESLEIDLDKHKKNS